MKKIKQVHLIYPVGNKISTPDTIGRHLKEALEKHYEVKTYRYNSFHIIKPGSADVLLGHWHPNPLTTFRMSARLKGWQRILPLAPFCPDPTGWHNAFAKTTIKYCDRYLAITGNAWMNRVKRSPFQHWEPKLVHLDLAVDRMEFPLLKTKYNSPGKRKFLYIGHTAWCKNTEFLEELAKQLPNTHFSWAGFGRILKNVASLGVVDFSEKYAHNLLNEYDFLLMPSSSDANPTTILEAMAWGLIPLSSLQSGYEGFPSIRNLSIENLEEAVSTIENLQFIPESKLKEWQKENIKLLDQHFNWERFCNQVLEEIETRSKPEIENDNSSLNSFLKSAEKQSPYYWKRPRNLTSYLKTIILEQF